jgi:hypothetical protein
MAGGHLTIYISPCGLGIVNIFVMTKDEQQLLLLQPASGRRRRAAVADQILATNLGTLWGPVYLSWPRPRSARLGSIYERQAAANSLLIAR